MADVRSESAVVQDSGDIGHDLRTLLNQEKPTYGRVILTNGNYHRGICTDYPKTFFMFGDNRPDRINYIDNMNSPRVGNGGQAKALQGNNHPNALGVVTCDFESVQDFLFDLDISFLQAAYLLTNGYDIVIPWNFTTNAVNMGGGLAAGRQADMSSQDVQTYISNRAQALCNHAELLRTTREPSLIQNSLNNLIDPSHHQDIKNSIINLARNLSSACQQAQPAVVRTTTHRVIGAAPRGNDQAAANNGRSAPRQVTEVIDVNEIFNNASDLMTMSRKNKVVSACSPAILFTHDDKCLTIIGFNANRQKQKIQIDPQKRIITRTTRQSRFQIHPKPEVLYKEKNGKVEVNQQNKLNGASHACGAILEHIINPTNMSHPTVQADGHYSHKDQEAYKLRLIAMANSSRLLKEGSTDLSYDVKPNHPARMRTYSYKLNLNGTPEFHIYERVNGEKIIDTIIRVNSDGHITIGGSLKRRTVEWDNSIADIVIALEDKIQHKIPLTNNSKNGASTLLLCKDEKTGDRNLLSYAAAHNFLDEQRRLNPTKPRLDDPKGKGPAL